MPFNTLCNLGENYSTLQWSQVGGYGRSNGARLDPHWVTRVQVCKCSFLSAHT